MNMLTLPPAAVPLAVPLPSVYDRPMEVKLIEGEEYQIALPPVNHEGSRFFGMVAVGEFTGTTETDGLPPWLSFRVHDSEAVIAAAADQFSEIRPWPPS